MNDFSRQPMKEELHALREHILRFPAVTKRSRWVRNHVANNVLAGLETDFEIQYRSEYNYAVIQNDYLAGALEAYDKGDI